MLVHGLVHSLRHGDSDRHVLVVGDLNDADADLATANGPDASGALAKMKNANSHCWQSYDCGLVNVLSRIPQHRRFSCAYNVDEAKGSASPQTVALFDYILVDAELVSQVTSVSIQNDSWQWDSDAKELVPRKDPISDHYPVTVRLAV